MTRISTEAAAKQLPELIAAAVAGEDIELTLHGRPVARLVALAGAEGPHKRSPHVRLEADAGVGIWADRNDIVDGAAWVSKLRASEWNRA